MLIYEVNVTIDKNFAQEYANFLGGHIPKILQIDGFKSCEWFERSPEDENLKINDEKTLWTIHYRVENREKLNQYLNNQASVMRAEALEKFGNHVSINRRILQLKII